MIGGRRSAQIVEGTSAGQLERSAARSGGLLLGRQRTPGGLSARGLFLLRFDCL
jgi:hypothetical protein